MNTQLDLTSAHSIEMHTATAAERAAMDLFQNTLAFCLKSWLTGKATVLLPINIQESFGVLLVDFIVTCLAHDCGGPVTLTYAHDQDGQNTLVHMPEHLSPQSNVEAQSVIGSQPKSSEVHAVKPVAPVASMKKAPRPMNCWIIFRDYMHKQLKTEHPELSVQEISTKCSEVWRNMSPEDKLPWKQAAQSAKEEHKRLHPDYKYSPRKPGEKKKRQSRKAKLAAAATRSDTPQLRFDASVTFESMPDTSTANTGSITIGSFTEFTNSLSFLNTEQGSSSADLGIYASESLRQDRLQAEFADPLDVNTPLGLFGEGNFALRAGADGDLTLPIIISDGF